MLRYKDDPTSASIAYVGIALFIGALLFTTVGPKPTTLGLALKNSREQIKVQNQMEDMKKSLDKATAYTQQFAWSQDSQRVAPLTVTTVTALAKSNGLQLVGVRPQRADESAKPNQLPFAITVSGPYPAVMAFTQQLEAPKNRLVVNIFQLTTADANSNKVTATIGAVAYLIPPPPAPEPKETTPKKEPPTHA